MDIIKKLLTPGRERGRSMTPMKAEGVLIHYVGNPGSSALNNRNYFENGSGGNKVSAHYIVGLSGEIIQCVPEGERAAHAGIALSAAYKELAKTNNARFIGIEVCHPDASGRFSPVTYAALVELVADICIRYGFNPRKQVLRHYDVTGKQCPLYYVKNENEWEAFLTAVTIAVQPDNPATAGVYPVSEVNLAVMRSLGVMNSPEYWKDANIQYLNELLDKAAAPGILDKRICNGITGLDATLEVLADAGIVNTPDYWRGMAGNVLYVKELLVNMANKARIVLEKIIQAEACGEPPEGMVLVGNVIMNRCRAPGWPDGIYNVVFQANQFSPVTDGAYKRAVPSAAVKRAVDVVLSGTSYSNDAVFFRTVKGAAPDCWHETALTALFDCGGHRFYK
ncbi:MAG: N-acetylmuramoyl-L-alanine amidase [Clostridiales bacterium]|jgi:N-acetylmuramoyl-L-alanine amidase|nr:N-acetylmuramoyl-L-alanine amidase [Clostridiales bacterium]